MYVKQHTNKQRFIPQNQIPILAKHNKKSIVKEGHRTRYWTYKKGIVGNVINLLLSAAAFNFKRVMNLWKKEANKVGNLSTILLYIFIGNFMPKN